METMISKQSVLDDSWRSIKYEYRTEKYRRGSPLLLNNPVRQFRYRSLYGYGVDTVHSINTQGNTRGLTGQPLYSDCIVIDCDTSDEAEGTQVILNEEGLAYSRWMTGNRGCHFHIPIEPMWGTNVIWSQTCWLKDIGVWDIIDTSIYRANGQIRVPGAIHEKTGNPKVMVEEVKGIKPDVPELVAPPLPTVSTEVIEGTPEARNEYHRNLMYKRSEGGRHTHMFVLWNRGKSAGYDHEDIREDIRWWNDMMAQPSHTTSAVETKLRGFR